MGNAKNFEEDLERRGRTKREKGGRERTPNGVVDPRSIAAFFFLSLSGAKRRYTHNNKQQQKRERDKAFKKRPKKASRKDAF